MSVHHRRSTLWVKRDEVQWDRLTVRRTLVVQTMFQEVIEKRARFFRGRSGAGRAAHDRIWQSSADPSYRVVVEFVVLLSSAMPICDVRLVPNLKVPLADLFLAVTLYQMRRIPSHQLAPDGVVLRRIVGSPGNGARRVMDLVFGDPRYCGSQVLGHEPQLDHRPHTCLPKFIKG